MNQAGKNLVIILFIVIVVIGFISVGISFFRGGSDSEIVPRQVDLSNYLDESNTTAIYTVEGSIKAREEYREIRISISPTSRKLEIIQGYQGRVIESKRFPNDAEAYKEFLLALKTMGFTNKDFNADLEKPAGICPLGTRNIYEFQERGRAIYSAWATTDCDEKDQSFEGSEKGVEELFEMQIPEYSDLTRDTSLN
jgi:hypothetical protein